jgi:hypothetical protein
MGTFKLDKFIPTKVIVIGLLLLTIGCQPTANESSTMAEVTEERVEEQTDESLSSSPITSTRPISQMNTSTPMPSPTNTSTPQSTLTPLSTETIPPTQTPTATITPTPWPTLSPDEAANKVLTLLADNQNSDCLLPCWWGATPGQTRWQDIEPFLKSLAQKIYYPSSETSFGAEVQFPLPESITVTNDENDFHAFYGWDESGVIQGITIGSINLSGYDAKTMVTLYGIPDEVWLTSLDEPREGVLPFQLIIVYQQQGISFRYYVDATRNGEFVTACFEPGVIELERPYLFPASPRIYLWEPGEPITIQEISPASLDRYFSLEAKTDLTPQTLYEKFTNPNEQPCIDTPANLWRY